MRLLIVAGEFLFIGIGLIFTIEAFIVLCSPRSRVPFVRTSSEYFDTVMLSMKLTAGSTLYDLGSGDGSFILACALQNPTVRCIGVERNPLLHLRARVRKYVAGNPENLTLMRANIFDIDLSAATHAYAYLFPSVLALLLPTLVPRAKVLRFISCAFPFPNSESADVIDLSSIRRSALGQHRFYIYKLL